MEFTSLYESVPVTRYTEGRGAVKDLLRVVCNFMEESSSWRMMDESWGFPWGPERLGRPWPHPFLHSFSKAVQNERVLGSSEQEDAAPEGDEHEG
jgi:hypothetical protein